MHAFKFTCPFALILATAYLAIAAPTSDVHANAGSGAVVHAVGNVPDSAAMKDHIATHSPAGTSTTDKSGSLTLKVEASSQCSLIGSACWTNSNCCSRRCRIFNTRSGPVVSAPLR